MNPNIQEGIVVTIMGVCIVFAVLLILMVVLYIMQAVFRHKNGTVVPVQKAEPAIVPAKASVASQPEAMDEEELIAVLTAAIASSLNTSTYNLQIKSYRQVGSNAPVWNNASRRENIENNLY